LLIKKQDEVVSISEKVVLKVADLATWIVEDVKWERGSPSVWDRKCSTTTTTTVASAASTLAVTGASSSNTAVPSLSPTPVSTTGPIDMCDVIKEKSQISTDSTYLLLISVHSLILSELAKT
jgi:hypothetical protein